MNNELLLAGKLLSAKLHSLGKKKGSIVSKTVRVNSEDYTYQLFVPPSAKESSGLPVITFLHGIRERGSGGFVPALGPWNTIITQYLGSVPALILLPQCAPGKYWPDPAMDEMVIKALDRSIEEYNCDSKRLYLAGVSMGGYGVWHFASHYPEKFAALVSICGGSPVMNGDRFTPIAEKSCKTPAWLFHGAQDRIVPVTESRMMVKALEDCGGNARYSEYENVGHNVWLNALNEKELLPWILSQSRG